MYSYFPFSPPFTKTCVYVCVFFYILLSLPKGESGEFSTSVHRTCPLLFRVGRLFTEWKVVVMLLLSRV